MAVSGKILYQGQPGTSEAELYQGGTGIETYIDSAVVCNPTGSSATLTLAVVDGGGSLADANTIYSAFTVAAGDTTTLGGLVNMRLEAADEIRGLASAGSTLTLTITGREVS